MGKQFFLKCGLPPMGTMSYIFSLLYLVGSKCVTKYDVTSNQQPSKNDGKCDLMNISIIFSNLSNIMIAFNPVFFFSVSHRCHINSPSHLNCPLCPQKELSESSNFSKVCCSSWKFLDLSRTLKHPCPNNLFPFRIFETKSLMMKNIPCCQLPKKKWYKWGQA